MQGFETSCEHVNKKSKKNKKLVNGAAEDGVTRRHSEVITGDKCDKSIHKTKSVKLKKFPKESKDGSDELDNGIHSSPDGGHRVKKKKKSVMSCIVSGHERESAFTDVGCNAEEKPHKDYTIHMNDDVNKSHLQPSDSHLKSSLTGCRDKKRKRKKKDEKNLDLDSKAGVQAVDEQSSKKLKINNDKTNVVSSSIVQPGAFEKYRISPSMADKLRCMLLLSQCNDDLIVTQIEQISFIHCFMKLK